VLQLFVGTFPFQDTQNRGAHLVKHLKVSASIALQVLRRGKKKDLRDTTSQDEMASHYQAITTVVPLSAKHRDGNALQRPEMLFHFQHDSRPSIFHEHHTGHSVPLRCQQVYFAHLRGNEDFHALQRPRSNAWSPDILGQGRRALHVGHAAQSKQSAKGESSEFGARAAPEGRLYTTGSENKGTCC
jgi:hypothetical protein